MGFNNVMTPQNSQVMLVCRDGKVLGPFPPKDIPKFAKELSVGVDFVITSGDSQNGGGWIPIEQFRGVELSNNTENRHARVPISSVPWGWLITLAALVGAFVFFVWRGLSK